MTISSNSTTAWAADGTITPTAPLVEGAAATTFSTSTGFGPSGPGWQNAAFTARTGCRVTFASALDLTSHTYVSFGLGPGVYYPVDDLDSYANGGIRIVFIDGSGNYKGYSCYHKTSDLPGFSANNNEGWWSAYTVGTDWFIDRGRAGQISSGTLNWANIVAVEFTQKNTSAKNGDIGLAYIKKRNKISVTGTETFDTVAAAGGGSNQSNLAFTKSKVFALSASQTVYTTSLGLAVGDGATATNLTQSNFSLGIDTVVEDWPTYSYPGPYVQVNTSVLDRYIDVNQSASCVLSLTDGSFASSSNWGFKLRGSASGSATCTRVSFLRFADFIAAHGTYANCTWNAGTAPVTVTAATVITNGTIVNATTSGMKITGAAGTYSMTCSFANPSATYDIELGSGGAGTYTLSNITVTGAYVLKLRNNSATNAITVSIPAGMSYSTSTAGGTISVTSPSVTQGLAFTGLIAGSQVKVFTTTTTTELFTTSSSGTSETWSQAGGSNTTVDYTIMKAGYLPIRVVGVTVNSAVLTTPISQVADRTYVASSGLTYTTNATITVGTKIVTWSVATTVQNLYSFFIEAWIAQSSLKNTAFPFTSNGPNSITFGNGWESRGFTTAGTGISNTSLSLLSRDGLRYTDTSGTRTAAWAAILTSGALSGSQVRYQQSDGASTTNAANTGEMDQLVQIYGDASHGNFDKTGYLVLKVQREGYDQAENNLVSLYGTLEDQLYVAGLAPTPNGVATGNPAPATAPVITTGTFTEAGKTYGIKIVDGSTPNTGTNILRWLRYNFAAGGTFQSRDGFNWHDLVQVSGTGFKTVRGNLYGSAASKGVIVYMNNGTTLHPDFNLFTADDGTTYTPPQAATITISGVLAGSRVQIYDTLNSVELLNSTSTYTYSETYSVARDIRVRIGKQSTTTAYNFIEASIGSIGVGAYSLTYLASQTLDTTYNTNAIDGSTVTGISITPGPGRVSINLAGGSTTYPRIYAYQVYWLTTSTGIADEAAFISAPDTANYLFTGFKLKNTSATPLTITGGWGRDATSGLVADIIDSAGSTGNIYPQPDHAIPYSSGSGLTAGQAASLAAVQSSTANLTYSGTALNANITKVNGTTISGAGTASNPWGP